MYLISSTVTALKSALKSWTYPVSLVFFILSVDQSLRILPKHNGLATIAESFALNFIISVPLTNK